MDTDILKTLESIEKLLKGASAFTGAKPLPASTARSQAAQQTSSQKAGRDANKAFKATAVNLKDTNDAVLGLNKGLIGLNSEVGRTTVGFGSLNSQMAKFVASLTPLNVQPQVQQPAEPIQLPPAPAQPPVQNIKVTEVEVPKAAPIIPTPAKPVEPLVQPPVQNIKVTEVETPKVATPAIPAKPAQPIPAKLPIIPIQGLDKLQIPLEAIMGRMIDKFGQTTVATGGMEVAFKNLWALTERLTGEFFALSRVGMGSATNLFDLSKYALQSGMALKDYQAIITTNITAASRAGTLENFNKIISAADTQLAGMGIFGQEAREMQASLANSNTGMGIAQDQLTSSIQNQISVFDALRKSTNMTAEEFDGLVKDLSHNEQVQKELVGLAPAQRQARQAELLQIATTGQRMGLAADASKALADALIAQRSETVKGRFEESGQVRQLGQLLGMGAQGDRAAQIAMKGRGATAAETEELRGIMTDMDKAQQDAYQTGSLGMQSALDHFNDTLGQGKLGKIMEATRPATLAQDSGKVNQEAFGKHVGEFGAFTGQLLAWAHGFNQSIGPMIGVAIGGATLAVFKGPIMRALEAGLVKVLPGAAGIVGGGEAAAASVGGVKSLFTVIQTSLSSLTSADLLAPIKSLPSSIKGVGSSLMDMTKGAIEAGKSAGTFVANGGPLQAMKAMFQDFGGTIGNAAKSAGDAIKGGWDVISRGLKTFTKSFGLAAGLVDAVIEMVTGEISTALNPSGGFFNRLGGVVSAFFSAIPNFIIDVLGYVFGDNLGKTLQNGFDQFVAGANGAIKTLFAAVFKGWYEILSRILPDDSKLVKTLKTWADDTTDSATSNFQVAGQLADDHSKTLSTISKQNQKVAEKAAAGSEAATTKAIAAQAAYNNVQYGTDLTKESAVQDARALIGSPQVQVPTAVKPVAVNTPDAAAVAQAAAAANAAAGEAGATSSPSAPDVIGMLTAILQVMKDNLTQGVRQGDLTEQLMKSNRPTATFAPAEVMAQRMLAHTD